MNIAIPEAIVAEAAGLGPAGEHAVFWYPDRWVNDPRLASVQDRLAAVAANCEGSVTEHEKVRITRNQVFAAFRGDDAVAAFLAAMVWGYGTGARGRYRVARITRVDVNPGFEDRLHTIIDAARTGNSAAAWEAFMSRARLKYLGPAFATKVAYFAAFSHGPPPSDCPPLIGDSLVDLALGSPGLNRWQEQYVAYTRAARLASEGLPGHLRRADQIEYALFRRGQHLRSGPSS